MIRQCSKSHLVVHFLRTFPVSTLLGCVLWDLALKYNLRCKMFNKDQFLLKAKRGNYIERRKKLNCEVGLKSSDQLSGRSSVSWSMSCCARLLVVITKCIIETTQGKKDSWLKFIMSRKMRWNKQLTSQQPVSCERLFLDYLGFSFVHSCFSLAPSVSHTTYIESRYSLSN